MYFYIYLELYNLELILYKFYHQILTQSVRHLVYVQALNEIITQCTMVLHLDPSVLHSEKTPCLSLACLCLLSGYWVLDYIAIMY